ncbi:MAG: Ig-like domain-containing protein [Gemmatimonadota bacterium]
MPLLLACAPAATESSTQAGTTDTPIVLRVALRDSALVVGDTAQLTVTRTPATEPTGTLTFTSSDTTVVVVAATGLVTTRGAGRATITVRQATSSAAVELTVASAVAPSPVDTTPSTPPVNASAWRETFTGETPVPTPFSSDDWNVQQYSRDEDTWLKPSAMQAQHAHDCGGPPLVHTISTYAQQVFRCRDHVMTAVSEGGYGTIVLTPNRMLDWAAGEQVLRFAVNTATQSPRDWWAVWLTPFADVLPVPTYDWAPALNGYPRTSVMLEQSSDGVCPAVVVNYVHTKLPCNAWQALSERMAVSFSVRTVIELRISRTHIKVWMPEHGIVFTDADLPAPLSFTQGVVQFAHYSYNPAKDCPAGKTCGPNTWHWDDIDFSNPVPFRIIKADVRAVNGDNVRVTFSAPAPANATLRLTGGGYHPLLSFDNGVTWVQPTTATYKPKDAPEAQYATPIPAGVSSMLVKRGPVMVDWWPNGWVARDFTIWSR